MVKGLIPFSADTLRGLFMMSFFYFWGLKGTSLADNCSKPNKGYIKIYTPDMLVAIKLDDR